MSSFSTFELPTSILRKEILANEANVEQYYREYAGKYSQTDGMVMDAEGNLYLGDVVHNSVSTFNPIQGQTVGDLRILAQDNTTLIWADTFSIDDAGYLYVTTRGWPLDKNRNFIVRFYIGVKSYLYD